MRSNKHTAIKWSLLALSLLHVGAASAIPLRQPSKFNGGRVTVQTAAGGSCSSTAPDRASIGVIAGTTAKDYQELNTTSSFGGGSYRDNSELVAGVGLVVPIGGTVSANCNKLVEMEEARTKMELAVTLYESGALSKEELNVILTETKSILLK